MERQSERFRVRLAVRFSVARDFVIEYAENLSSGGLFIATQEALERRQAVSVELTLPGLGSFLVQGEVAHVLDAALAARCQRSAGAGIEITEAPKGFAQALEQYLQRLGRRADHSVLVAEEQHRPLLRDAGYQVVPAPEPRALLPALVRAQVPVVAVVVPRAAVARYAAAAIAAGAEGSLIVPMDVADELDVVLSRLDQQL